MKNIKKAFTLIELLVVITIIGILATGAISIYTSQIQKARDTTRINDIKALQSGIEQFYQDTNEYPQGGDFGKTAEENGDDVSGIMSYVPKIPKDPKSGQKCNKGELTTNPKCDYVYGVKEDENGISYGAYEISTAFENSGNITKYAKKDSGDTNATNRYEIGNFVSAQGGTIDTNYNDGQNKGAEITDKTNTSTKITIQGKIYTLQ